jgi:1,4-dihydroxy-2-naphthoyl-CoA hydrolase
VTTETVSGVWLAGKAAAPDADLTRLLHELMPFTEVLGLEVLRASAESVETRVAWEAERCTAGRTLHGGYLMAIADATGAACAAFHLPTGGATTVTIESKTNFLRGVGRGSVRITSTPLFIGTTTVVIQTDLTRDDGRLVARTTQTQAIHGRNVS